MTHQKNTKVLVVDDDEPSRDLFCKALTSAGYAVPPPQMDSMRYVVWRRHDSMLSSPTFAMPQMDGWNS